MYVLYNLILIFFFLVTLPYWGIKIVFSSRWREGIGQRFGFLPKGIKANLKKEDEYLWIHASSVGEAKIAFRIIEGIKKEFSRYKLLISSMTPMGIQILKNLYPDKVVIFAPLDLKTCIKRVINCFRIKALVLIETEIWPNLIRLVKQQQAVVVVLNGRISDKSFKKYKIFKLFLKKILSFVDIFAMQSKIHAERIISLGAERKKVKVTGNVKYDGILSKQTLELKTNIHTKDIYKEFCLSEDDLIWVAGSIRAGEEKIIVSVYKQVLKKHPCLKLIIAPRHLERISYLENLLVQESFTFVKKSTLHSAFSSLKVGGKFSPSCINIVILDTMGELMKVYTIATIVFVGGSLVKTGGHNILEPASLAKPVLFGPYMENFKEPALLLKEKNGGIEVKNEEDLEKNVLRLLSDSSLLSKMGKNGRKAVLSKQGATSKNLKLIGSLIKNE